MIPIPRERGADRNLCIEDVLDSKIDPRSDFIKKSLASEPAAIKTMPEN